VRETAGACGREAADWADAVLAIPVRAATLKSPAKIAPNRISYPSDPVDPDRQTLNRRFRREPDD
jgi:hypothetical protein